MAIDKQDDADNKRESGTLNIKSSAIHNDIKNSVENNHLNFSLTNSLLRPSVETNIVKGTTESNVIKATAEFNLLRFGSDMFAFKASAEVGGKRFSKTILKEAASVTTYSRSTSYSTNFEEERSFSQHRGKRFNVTVPPHLDVAIIDASRPNDAMAQMIKSDAGSWGWDEARFGVDRKQDMGLETNYIYLEEPDIPADAWARLESLKEWADNKETITNQEKFQELLEDKASPTFPGVAAPPFTPFKGGGMNVDTAKSHGATCRLQVSHGANQTIQIFSQALRTIRFNNVTTVDNGQNNQIYLGGKYEHIRGQAHTLVEGPLIQHHRKKIPTKTEDQAQGPNDNGVAKYRYEDGVSVAFVTADPDSGAVTNEWSMNLQMEGIAIGNASDIDQPSSLTQGLRITEKSLEMIHGDRHLKFPEDGGVVWSWQDKKMVANSVGIQAGDLTIRISGVADENPAISFDANRPLTLRKPDPSYEPNDIHEADDSIGTSVASAPKAFLPRER